MDIKFPILIFLVLILSACMTATQHREAVQDTSSDDDKIEAGRRRGKGNKGRRRGGGGLR